MNLGIGLGVTNYLRVPTVPLDPEAAIAALFESGEEGAWYDPSDMSTMYQDAAGTTPVTASGQPVGLILDKSKGGLSATELVTNGSFDNAAGWTETSGTLTISGGTATLAGTNQPDPFFVSASFSVNGGSWYKIQVDIVSAGGSPTNVNYIRLRTPGSFTGATGIVVPSATTGTRTAIVQIPAGWTTAEVCVQRGGAAIPPTTTLVVDNISIRELPGNHATQSTSAARPTLQVSGGLYYLDFDGVDDHLLATSVNFTGFTELQVLAGAQKDSDATVQRVFDLAGTGPVYSIQIPSNTSNLSSGLTVSNGSFVAAATACDAAPNLYLFNAYCDLSAPLVGFQFDQDAEVESTSSLGSTYADFGSSRTIHIGQRSNNSSRMNGGFYGLIIRSALLDATQLSDAQSYLAAKSGVTL